MCGIAGIISDNENHLRSIDSMVKVMEHRGPDDTGSYCSLPVAFGQNRLSIIDLAGGHQPMLSADKSQILIFNGEIYNYKELTRELEGKGYVFQTKSDSEVLLHLYAAYGPGMLSLLNGMFAFAIYDLKKQEVFIARDRLGVKPIYYYEKNGIIAFASEIQALRAMPEINQSLTINTTALWHYFSLLYIPQPLTIFNEIKVFPSGHYGVIKDGHMTTKEYWRPVIKPADWKNLDECANTLDELLDSATALRMQSDVPYGAYLSGGVDSSLIVGKMAAHSSTPVKTFTARIRSAELDELYFAETAAKKFGTEHTVVPIDDINLDLIRELLRFFGQPFADSSLLPTYLISKKIREHVTVVLGGDGSDEIFSGYDKYWRVLANDSDETVRAAFLNRVPEGAKETFFTKEFQEKVRPTDTFAYLTSHAHNANYRGHDLLRFLDLEFFLKGDILAKVDHMSMANSIEARGPFLDYRIVEFGLTVPSAFLVSKERNKVLVKHLLERSFPPTFVNRPKVGFMLPVAEWLRAHVDTIVGMEPPAWLRGIIDHAQVRHYAKAYQAGESEWGNLLFAYLVLCLWAEEHGI